MNRQEELEKMSDYEINSAVAIIWLPCDYYLNERNQTVDLVCTQTQLGAHGMPVEMDGKYGEFDPCNNPADIMPIAIEHSISIHKFSCQAGWQAYIEGYRYGDIYANSLNPYRAICIVFILMSESK